VPAMHAVEITDCHHSAMQRPGFAVTRDMEGLGRFVHDAISLLQGISVKACLFQRRAVFLDANTVTAPLINFQINGLFNSHR
jgi:hypothetical protein